jgi:hypothetical protein
VHQVGGTIVSPLPCVRGRGRGRSQTGQPGLIFPDQTNRGGVGKFNLAAETSCLICRLMAGSPKTSPCGLARFDEPFRTWPIGGPARCVAESGGVATVKQTGQPGSRDWPAHRPGHSSYRVLPPLREGARGRVKPAFAHQPLPTGTGEGSDPPRHTDRPFLLTPPARRAIGIPGHDCDRDMV